MKCRVWPRLAAVGLQTRLALVVALAILALSATFALSLFDQRQQTIAGAQAETSNLAESMAHQAKDTFELMDMLLVGLRERVEIDGLGENARFRLQRLLVLQARSLGLLHKLLVIDQTGRSVVTSDPAAPFIGGFEQLAFFRLHRDGPGREMLIGWPVRDTLDGTWVITVSRRVDNPDGSFAGVVCATVPTGYFRNVYAGFGLDSGGMILLARRDGVLMSRLPMAPQDEGADLRQGELFTGVVSQADRPAFEYVSPVDGLRRLGSYHWVPNAPVFALVSRGKADILAGWWRDARLHLFGFCSIVAALCLLGCKLWRKIGEGEAVRRLLLQSNDSLAQSEASMARAKNSLEMAEELAQIGHWHLQVAGSMHLTWSDEVYRMHGASRHRFVLTLESALDAYHPDDRDLMASTVSRSIESRVPFEIAARLMRADGVVRHVLSRGVPHTDETGQTTALFGVILDVSRQKRAELALLDAHASAEAANHALEAANRTLETMAMQDALTGLSNRRHFDRALDQEFRRAMRSQSSLALIMIDVDHFKPFNDIYGHQAGDACLRAISALIPPLLNRPGDTAARYGGEEIAVLLPGNTEDAAFAMASRIADAVRELKIPHEGSPKGVVTISAGLEAFVPVHERDEPAHLVRNADKLLYAAKHAGRDRVFCCRTTLVSEAAKDF